MTKGRYLTRSHPTGNYDGARKENRVVIPEHKRAAVGSDTPGQAITLEEYRRREAQGPQKAQIQSRRPSHAQSLVDKGAYLDEPDRKAP